MSGFLKFVGLITCIYGVYYVFTKFNEQTQGYIIYFFVTIGVIASLVFLSRLIFGKKWQSTLFKKAMVGEDLVQALEDTMVEFPKVSKKTKARLVGNLIFRFTRIGIIALLVASIPILLLLQQNILISKQNTRLDQQTHLLEADRRGSYVHLFSNIMDAIDREIQDDVGEKEIRDLSPQLISRIVSLSHSLKPYRFLEGDTLISSPLSPERGQLFMTLIYLELNHKTTAKIFREGNFQYSDLRSALFSGYKIPPVNLEHSDLSFTDFLDCELNEIEFTNCVLRLTGFFRSKLNKIRFKYSNLSQFSISSGSLLNCTFCYSDLNGARLTPDSSASNSFEICLMDFTDMNNDLLMTSIPFGKKDMSQKVIKTDSSSIDTLPNENIIYSHTDYNGRKSKYKLTNSQIYIFPQNLLKIDSVPIIRFKPI